MRSNPLATIHPVVRVTTRTRGEGAATSTRPSRARSSISRPRGKRAPAGSAVRGDRAARVLGAVQVGTGRRGVLGQPGRAAPGPRDFEHVEGDRVLHRITRWATFRWSRWCCLGVDFGATTSRADLEMSSCCRGQGSPPTDAPIELVDPRAAVRRGAAQARGAAPVQRLLGPVLLVGMLAAVVHRRDLSTSAVPPLTRVARAAWTLIADRTFSGPSDPRASLRIGYGLVFWYRYRSSGWP